jgi:carbonic anhydrase/acetyltransferase-like protein (isoleucine patch superfamily)
MREWREETFLRGSINRFFQLLARILPGGQTIRIMLHRARGVHIGRNVFISEDVILETACPDLITIEDRVSIGIRTIIIAHFRELMQGVRIESDAFVGPGVIILPNVVIGRGAVVAAGSVVTRSVPPMTVVQGNPAVPVARCGIPLGPDVTQKEFSRQLKPLAVRAQDPDGRPGAHARGEPTDKKIPYEARHPIYR